MRRGRPLLHFQQEGVIKLVEEQRVQGRAVGAVLHTLGIARATYYRWKRRKGGVGLRLRRIYSLTSEEKRLIEELQARHRDCGHRQVQGLLQPQGIFLSASAIYQHLKVQGQIEPYARRPAPWASPRYEIGRRNHLWGCDWTKLKIGSQR